MKVKFNGIDFKNPILTASGTFNFGEEYKEYMEIESLGGICTTGITLNKKEGNIGRRIQETSSGLLNSIGLENNGVVDFVENIYPALKNLDTNILVNLGGNDLKDYLEGTRILEDSGVDIMELNISCPNVKSGGMAFGMDEDVAYDLISKVRKIYTGQLIVKLSPNSDVSKIGKVAELAGADGLSLVNTFTGMAIDIDKRKPVFENRVAGLSGPCIKPIALRMVNDVAKVVKIPIIGIGGIKDYRDVVEFIMAGASLVQVGSMNFIKPDITADIIRDLKDYMERENIKNLEEIRGII